MEPLESILNELRDRYQGETSLPKQEENASPLPTTANSLTSLDALLQELGNNFSAQVPNPSKQETQQQEVNLDLQNFAQEQQAKRQQAIAEKAQAWLDSIDPFSGEGLWFEAFAKKYPSRLAAAIEFLGCSTHSDIS